MRWITAGAIGALLLSAASVRAANVTLVAPDAFTPIGYDAAHPLFVTGGTGGGGGTGGSVTQGTSPWVDNISQFGGSPVVTGTGPGGAGIPRFTFSNDSTIANTAFGISGALPAFATTPTFNIGTLGGAATAANQNSTPAGTSATNGQGVQGVTNGVPLAVTWTGQTVTSNLTQLAGTTLGGPSAYGTAPTGQVQGVNAFITNFPTGQATALNQTAVQSAPGTAATTLEGVQGATSDASDGQATSSTDVSAAARGYVFNGATWDRARPIAFGTAGAPGASVLTTQGAPLMVPYRTFPVATATQEGGIVPFVSGSASSGVVGKANPGNLYDVSATCTSACWLMVFNATAVPADGATTAGTASGNLQQCVPITAGSSGSIASAGSPPETYTVGIAVAISSTACATKTASTVGFIHGRAM